MGGTRTTWSAGLMLPECIQSFTVEMQYLTWQRGLCNLVIKLYTSNGRDYPELLRCTHVIQESLKWKGRRGWSNTM
jgi:hypothetical protein